MAKISFKSCISAKNACETTFFALYSRVKGKICLGYDGK